MVPEEAPPLASGGRKAIITCLCRCGETLPAACHLCPPSRKNIALPPDPPARVPAADPHVAEDLLVDPAAGPSSATTFA